MKLLLLFCFLPVAYAAVVVDVVKAGDEFRLHYDGSVLEYRRKRFRGNGIEEVFLKCHPYKEVKYCGKWQQTKDGKATKNPVKSKSRSEIDKKGDLVIHKVTVEDAGEYWSPDVVADDGSTVLSPVVVLQVSGI